MKISWFDSPSEIDAALETAERARAAGLHRYWNPQVANADPMVTLAIVGREVPDIGLGTSVVAMQTTFAGTLAAQSRTINQATGGRFCLGLGASHQPAMELQYGIEWRKPYTHMVEYLDALLPLLNEQRVSTTVSSSPTTPRSTSLVPPPRSCSPRWARRCLRSLANARAARSPG